MNLLRLILLYTIRIAFWLSLAGCTSLVERGTPGDEGDATAPEKFLRATSGQPQGSAQPAGAPWWKPFRDPTLDQLLTRVEANNPDAKAALARVDQAYAALGLTGAQRFPRVTADGSAIRQQDSQNNLLFPIEDLQYERYRLAANASWELDLWGRLRGNYRRDKFRAEAARADYEDALLSLQTTLARQYFALRFARLERGILTEGVTIRTEALRLQESRVVEGAGIELDAARARTELETTRAEAEAILRATGKLEHAIAVLAGEAPADFTSPKGKSPVRLPRVPAGLPSELLDRRPDLRAAERNLRAAAVQVGIRKVDFLPRITLNGTGGLASLKTQTLFAGAPSYFYTLGPQIDIPVFQAGTRGSAVDEAKAAWREAVEAYRAALLSAVREVEDSLLDLQILQRQLAAQQRALAAAAETARLSQARFDRGLVNYLEVVDAERSRLLAARTENALRAEEAAATIQLIQALGGGW